jgi:hypothetical protein
MGNWNNCVGIWGLISRIAAKLAAYALSIQVNRMLSSPDFAFATLIV